MTNVSSVLTVQRQRSRGNVTVFFGRHHLLDRADFRQCELLRRTSRTRRHIVEITLFLLLPQMISGVRQTDDAQYDSQREDATRTLDGSQQQYLRGSLGNSDVGKRDARKLQHNNDDPQSRSETIATSLLSQNFLLQTERVHADNIKRNDVGTSRRQPTSRR